MVAKAHPKDKDWLDRIEAALVGIAAAPSVLRRDAEIDELHKQLTGEADCRTVPPRSKLAKRVEEIRKADKAKEREENTRQGKASAMDFNDSHFVLMRGPDVLYGHWDYDAHDSFGQPATALVLQTKRQFLDSFENNVVPNPNDPRNDIALAQLWLRHPKRRTYYGAELRPDVPPGEDVPGSTADRPRLNLWTGFAVEPAPGDITPWREFVREVIANGDPAVEKFVHDLLALKFQNPAKVTGVVLGMIGQQGAGKGVLGNTVAKLFGQHGMVVQTKEQVIDRFNDHLGGICTLFADETFFSGDRKAADMIKSLITEQTRMYEEKFQSKRQGLNHLFVMTASNHDHALHVDIGDRRYMVTAVNEARIDDHAYWGPLNAWLATEAARAAILHEYLTRDVRGFIPQQARPVTEALRQQILASMGPIDRFWHEKMIPQIERPMRDVERMPRAMRMRGSYAEGAVVWTKEEIFRDFQNWYPGQPEARHTPIIDRLFWKATRGWLPAVVVENAEGDRLVFDDPKAVREAFNARKGLS